MKTYLVFCLTLLLSTAPLHAADMAITPFRTFNQQPTLQVYGLPLDSSAAITPPGRFTTALLQEVASSYTVNNSATEQLVFDGEGYRSTLTVRYGLADRFEAGVNIPYVTYGGGFLDSFIVDWHDAFGLPQGGRDSAAKGVIDYRYRRDGVTRMQLSRSGSGLGDISLVGGMQLYAAADDLSSEKIALRADLKLPTGESAALRGSGSTDLALSLCAMKNSASSWGTLGLFGSLGGLAMTDSRILADQQNNFAAFGTLGIGWGPAAWISFKLQLNAATPFYRHSSLAELGKSSLMLVSGGALLLPDDYQLDIGVGEDIAVATAPDVTFHFGLSKQF